jgi:hypothetical protein
MKTPFLLLLAIVVIACNSQPPLNNAVLYTDSLSIDTVEISKFDAIAESPKDRIEIVNRLSKKIDQQEPLIVHCLVPLCDNDNQGIIPTTASLGDGFSLRTNLYWATSYGMKKFFTNNDKWKNLTVSNFPPTDTILERVAFERTFENGARVVLICDAYRGDMMAPCVQNYLNSLAGLKHDSINYDNSYLQIAGGADLVALNGHNGLMDAAADTAYATELRMKDAVVIACASKDYFNPYFLRSNSYPLVNTTSLLWPGAMCLDRIIEHWAMLKSDEIICNGAGDAYHEVKDCGVSAARRMFYTGW